MADGSSMVMHGFPTDDDGSDSAMQASTEHVYATLQMSNVAGQAIERDVLRETTLIGSGAGCDVRLKSSAIAPAHCILSLDGGTLRLRDLGSRAGTVINGERVHSAILSDGDEILLGPHRIRVSTNLPGRGFRGFYLDIYHVTEILGSGGMCWIYGGRNTITRERVALKVLPSQHTPRMLAHFGIEARAGLLLSHPNIARVYKLQQVDSLYFLVMEYLEAISLQELVESQGPLDWRQACSLTRQVAAGLEHTHQRGIVHRDVKPANILCTRDGASRLIDFGLAMVADDPNQEKLSRIYAHQILGTADYISPEQSRKSHDVDARADIYSLGCSLYFALTGCVPFPVLSIQDKISAHRQQTPRNPREIVPDLPESVAGIVLRMLAKDRDARFPRMSDVVGVLADYALQQPLEFDWQALLSVRAASAQRRLARQLRKRPPPPQKSPATPVEIDVAADRTSPPAASASQEQRPIEAEFMESLRPEDAGSSVDRAAWGQLFALWTQMTEPQRQQLLASAQELALAQIQQVPS